MERKRLIHFQQDLKTIWLDEIRKLTSVESFGFDKARDASVLNGAKNNRLYEFIGEES